VKWDFAIGNPAYQDQTLGDNKGFAPPVYDKFIDAACEIADKVEMIHPARFLFNAGSTPKAWNEKMLGDPHFKVLEYEEDASRVFSNTEIKGGVAITYHDNSQIFGEIGIFTPFNELNSLLKKITPYTSEASLSDIAVSGYSYHFTNLVHKDHPEFLKTTIIVKGKETPLISKGHEYDLKSNIIEKLPSIFFDNVPNDGKEYITIVGRADNKRVSKFIRKDYINTVVNLYGYKLFLPKASGIGTFGEILAPAMIAAPGTGHTETFFSIGNFKTEKEAENLHKYLKAKFSRSSLSVLKRTQMLTPGSFKYVPLQDFSENSDINWSTSVANIDKQLYKKYDLSQEEIDFIESHVKEME
jgi:hypothetical protein